MTMPPFAGSDMFEMHAVVFKLQQVGSQEFGLAHDRRIYEHPEPKVYQTGVVSQENTGGCPDLGDTTRSPRAGKILVSRKVMASYCQMNHGMLTMSPVLDFLDGRGWQGHAS